VHRIELSYALTGQSDTAGLIRNPLMDLLQAVRSSGSISGAAKALGLSYRHVWGELKRWEQTLGQPLIVWEKGQPAHLSAFGDKLLWAERQAQARLSPQIEALRVDLARAFSVAFDDAAHVLTFYASHDEALSVLREHALAHTPEAQGAAGKLHLDIRFTGSVDAIQALNQGRCVMAGFHAVPSPSPTSHAAVAYRPLLQPGQHKLIGFARRSQGLIVRPGNPRGIESLADLTRPGVRLVNRAIGTGTRVLLDDLLQAAGVDAAQVTGYASAEPSHDAVAQAVASGAADAGPGIEAAARARGLGFVPLVDELYYLVCLKSALESPAVAQLLAVLRSTAWQAMLGTIPGYAPHESGNVLSLKQVLPWWAFKAQRGAAPRAQSAQVRKPTKKSSRSGV
jgi:putative molybdopterin biosynthesis protein